MNLMITVGVPGSGKSTWAREQAKYIGNCVLVSRDDIRRNMGLDGKFTKEKEKLVTAIQGSVVGVSLSAGKNVIVHNTHLHKSDIEGWREVAKALNANFHIEYFDVCIVELLKRNHNRAFPEALPVSRVWEMFTQYKKLRGWVPASERIDASLPRAVIFDMDGTLTHVTDRSPYDTTKVLHDKPNIPVQELFKIHQERGDKCIVFTGREDIGDCRRDSLENLWVNKGLIPDGFFMRKEGDHRPDIVVKEEMLYEHVIPFYNPVLAVDDRDQVVGMWRMNGIPCFQVGYGDF